jgi:hypothetical protein
VVWSLAGLLWLPAFVGLLLGHRRVAMLLAVLALLPDAAAAISDTLALLAPAVLGLRVLSLLDHALVTTGGQRSALLAVGAGQALAVLAVAGPLARRAADALRRLPPLPAAPTRSSPPTW